MDSTAAGSIIESTVEKLAELALLTLLPNIP
jgi:hypothetical protein